MIEQLFICEHNRNLWLSRPLMMAWVPVLLDICWLEGEDVYTYTFPQFSFRLLTQNTLSLQDPASITSYCCSGSMCLWSLDRCECKEQWLSNKHGRLSPDRLAFFRKPMASTRCASRPANLPCGRLGKRSWGTWTDCCRHPQHKCVGDVLQVLSAARRKGNCACGTLAFI